MAQHSIAHGAFTVERRWKSSPAKVFKAWADPKLKQKWFGTPEADNPAHIFEFRVGGREYNAGKGPDGNDYTFDVRYYDIVPDNRIVYAYEMELNGQRISVSVATIEFRPDGGGTQLIVTEHGAFLDGLDTSGAREEGTNFIMDQLGAFLEKQG